MESDRVSFTINIYYKGKNGSAREFAKEMISSGIVEEIRSKKGNLRYEYFEPLYDNPKIVWFFTFYNQKVPKIICDYIWKKIN